MKNPSGRNLWINYLRSTLTVLVVAHHASLAYTTFARFDPVAYINSTHPIVDTHRWIGLDIFENFNDVFFMALMFLISGLFVRKSMDRKGPFPFITERFYRLFLPFLLGGTGLMLLAYFPAYYLAHTSTDVSDYVLDYFTVERYPVGPPWFIWVLFAFNLLSLLIYPAIRRHSAAVRSVLDRLSGQPLLFFLGFYAFTWLLYVPLAYSVGAGAWTGIGPFDFQISRILLYLGYFLFGVCIGVTDFDQTIFNERTLLVRRWRHWCGLALAAYAVLTLLISYEPLSRLVSAGLLNAFAAWMLYYAVYTASCTLSSTAFLTFFRSHIRHSRPWWDSLSENAYLIYLIHYVFVTWIQFFLLPVEMPAFAKFFLTFVCSLFCSWGISLLLRKIPAVRTYL